VVRRRPGIAKTKAERPGAIRAFSYAKTYG
jgi:hypothetical protein